MRITTIADAYTTRATTMMTAATNRRPAVTMSALPDIGEPVAAVPQLIMGVTMRRGHAERYPRTG